MARRGASALMDIVGQEEAVLHDALEDIAGESGNINPRILAVGMNATRAPLT